MTSPTENALALCVEGLSKDFGGAPVLAGLDLEVPRGSCTAVLGASGCGKTTLLRIVAGLERADAGRVAVAGTVTDDPRPRVPPEKRGVGLVFQDQALWPHMDVRANLEFVLDARRVPRAEREEAVRDALDATGLDHGLLGRRPGELSGGERQRAAVARALVQAPSLLLLDEPLTGLDRDLRYHLIATLRHLRTTRGLATLLVTHDQEEAFALADRVALLDGGRVVQQGAPEEVYRSPATRFVAEFVGVGSCLAVERENGRLITPLGSFDAEGAPSGPVLAMFRPEDIEVETTSDCRGRVLDAFFQGDHWMHEVEVGDTVPERLLVKAPERLAVGQPIGLQARRPAFVPADGPQRPGGQ